LTRSRRITIRRVFALVQINLSTSTNNDREFFFKKRLSVKISSRVQGTYGQGASNLRMLQNLLRPKCLIVISSLILTILHQNVEIRGNPWPSCSRLNSSLLFGISVVKPRPADTRWLCLSVCLSVSVRLSPETLRGGRGLITSIHRPLL